MSEPTSQPQFDVFLSHNSKDKPAVIALAKRLQAHGIKVWLDIWELRPGQPWQEALEEIIETTKAAAVLVGADGLGPWQSREMRGCLSEFAERGKTVIPVLLPTCPTEIPKLPFFLKQLTWVDFRDSNEDDAIEGIIWGITGVKLFNILPVSQANMEIENSKEGCNGNSNLMAESTSSLELLNPCIASSSEGKFHKLGETLDDLGAKPLNESVKPTAPLGIETLNKKSWQPQFFLHKTIRYDLFHWDNKRIKLISLLLLFSLSVIILASVWHPTWYWQQPTEDSVNSGQGASQKQVAIDAPKPIADVVTQKAVKVPVSYKVEPEMVSLKGGEFWMGSDKQTDPLADIDEMPRHKVTVKPFSIGKYEITKGEFAEFVRATKYQIQGCSIFKDHEQKFDASKSWNDPGYDQTDKHPVVCVSHEDAETYCNWLKEKTGKPYRLPTEAEWEYAARAGTQTPWYWQGGGKMINDYAWNFYNAGRTTHPVGQKKPNAFGINDIAGNVWEWTQDRGHDNYEGAPSDGTAWKFGITRSRVVRGGSWNNADKRQRSAIRDRFKSDMRNWSIGFRLVLDE